MDKVNRVVYQVWTAGNPMPDVRKACCASSRENIPVPVELITPDNLQQYVVPGHPLHPAYEYLHPSHRSDYMRCYLMHFHGGGYSDIKFITKDNNWAEALDMLDADPRVDVVGAYEAYPGSGNAGYGRPSIARHLIATCFIVARPMSEYTRTWFDAVENLLTVTQRQLERCPAGADGYPIPWTGLSSYMHMACLAVTGHRPEAVRVALRTGWDASVSYK